MDVDKMLAIGTRLMSPKASAVYLWIGIPAGILLLIGKTNSNQLLISIGGIIIVVIFQIMFLFFFSMTLNALRKEECMRCLTVWKKALLLSISVVPICGLAFIHINLLRKLLDFYLVG